MDAAVSLAPSAEPKFEVTEDRSLNPMLYGRREGNGLAIAVARGRELLDRLERGELDGCSFEWRHPKTGERDEATGVPFTRLRTVTVTPTKVQMLELTIDEVVDGAQR